VPLSTFVVVFLLHTSSSQYVHAFRYSEVARLIMLVMLLLLLSNTNQINKDDDFIEPDTSNDSKVNKY
jgi:hypothetical protein